MRAGANEPTTAPQIVEWVKDGHHKDPMAPYPAPIPPRGPHFVAELTNDNFTVAEAAPETWVVNFYSPECGHCRLFERPYEELSVALHDNGGLRFGRVNCRRDEVSCKRYGINSWPTVCVIRDGMVWAPLALARDGVVQNGVCVVPVARRPPAGGPPPSMNGQHGTRNLQQP